MADIFLVGVGGQGIITASKVIGDAAILEGKKVLLSETHGMAQRGGSVVCTARIGNAYSPLIPDGKADLILSFELLETLRAICKASPRTLVIASSERIVPLSVSAQRLTYPSVEHVRAQAKKAAKDFVIIDAPRLALESGAPMSANIVMVGALAGTGVTGIDRRSFEKAVEMNIPRRLSENIQAFSKGFDAIARSKLG
ncbi:MAG: indolepyruvate oxidoreductase subunit beta [Thermoplasmata archaeon]